MLRWADVANSNGGSSVQPGLQNGCLGSASLHICDPWRAFFIEEADVPVLCTSLTVFSGLVK